MPMGFIGGDIRRRRRMSAAPVNPSASFVYTSFPSSLLMNNVTSDGVSTFVAVPHSTSPLANVGLRSTDHGVTWSQFTLPETAPGKTWYIDYGSGVYIAVNESNGNTYKSTDNGINWSLADTGASGYGGTAPIRAGIRFLNNKFVKFGSSPEYSSDLGVTWNVATGINNDISDAAYGNGKYVATSSGGTTRTVFYSNDGIAWSSGELLPDPPGFYGGGDYTGVTFNGERFFACYYHNGGTVTPGSTQWAIASSFDGTTWDNSPALWTATNYGLNPAGINALPNGKIIQSTQFGSEVKVSIASGSPPWSTIPNTSVSINGYWSKPRFTATTALVHTYYGAPDGRYMLIPIDVY